LIRDRSSLVVRWLSSGVNDEIRTLPFEEIANRLAITNVEGIMIVLRKGSAQPGDDGGSRSCSAEEFLPQVIVDTDHGPSLFTQQTDALRSDKTARTGNRSLLSLQMIFDFYSYAPDFAQR
jgi:hypothetical protein